MVYISTCSGKTHKISEDAVLVGREISSETSRVFEMPENGFICIADGVGGNRGGDVASRYILDSLTELQGISYIDIKQNLIRINNELIRFAAEKPSSSEMATTLTGFYVQNGHYYLIHIGNTRAYIRQGKYLKQITSDHTTYNWLISSGQTEAAETSNRNEITNCFGGKNPALLSKLYVAERPLFSLAVLTSDGVHENISLEELEDIIGGEGSFEEKCQRVIRKAFDSGSEDDMSVVII